MGFNSALEG